jgi:aminoglycoside 6'-N-acetyltransferase I
MEIHKMHKDLIKEYAIIYKEAFSVPPWGDPWTDDSAVAAMTDVMNVNHFIGFEIRENNHLLGFICGYSFHFFDGLRFEIKEFCVSPQAQGSGLGTKLLDYMIAYLEKQGIDLILLFTSPGERTEGYYTKRGFQTDQGTICMYKK